MIGFSSGTWRRCVCQPELIEKNNALNFTRVTFADLIFILLPRWDLIDISLYKFILVHLLDCLGVGKLELQFVGVCPLVLYD